MGSKQPAGATFGAQGAAGRSLKTGSETLRALRMLALSPAGLAPDELGDQLGKSKATARYLLNTLAQEGFAYRDSVTGSYRLAEAPPWGAPWGSDGGDAGTAAAHLSDALTETHRRTRQRSYLAQVEDERVVVLDSRGHQGLPRIPGLAETIPVDQAHALAVCKALAAPAGAYGEQICAESSFARFTRTTITDRNGFEDELGRVRQLGFALDREEFADGFCCVAAPVSNPQGKVVASLAVSLPAKRFETECLAMIDDLTDIAATATATWSGNAPGGQVGDERAEAAWVPAPRPSARSDTRDAALAGI